MKKNDKGFTLMEMLIVVAIIAVLAAIAIPTFRGSTIKAKRATDEANIYTAYSEASRDFWNDAVKGTAVSKPLLSDGEDISLPNGEIYTTVAGERLEISVYGDGKVVIVPYGK